MPRIVGFYMLDYLDKVACALFSSDEEFRLIRANDSFRKWSGSRRKVDVFALYPDMPEDRFRKGITKRGRFSFQTTLKNDKREVDVHLSFRRIERNGQEYIFLQGNDRSREREKDQILARATQLLEKRNRELDQLNQELTDAHNQLILTGKLTALGEMATSMILEMRHPLELIMVNASLLDEYMRDEDATEMLQTVVQSGQHVTKIVESLRGFSQSEARDSFQKRKVQTIVEDTLNLIQTQVEDKGVDLQVMDIEEELEIDCHPTEICQVLMNLISNSCEAVAGDDDAWVRVEAAPSKEGDTVEISVVDSGGGLPPALADKLMEPFFTTKDAGAGTGTGLGLTISRKIVQSHRGSLHLDGDCEDTRFYFVLPLVN